MSVQHAGCSASGRRVLQRVIDNGQKKRYINAVIENVRLMLKLKLMQEIKSQADDGVSEDDRKTRRVRGKQTYKE